MEEHQIKLIKWGLVFLGDPAVLKFGPTLVEITKNDGTKALSCAPQELKRANYNSNNGMITLKSNNGQKCNIQIKNDDSAQKFSAFLDQNNIKGFSI